MSFLASKCSVIKKYLDQAVLAISLDIFLVLQLLLEVMIVHEIEFESH